MREVVSLFHRTLMDSRHYARFNPNVVVVPILLVMLALGWSAPLHAQRNTWNLIFTFDRPIGCGFFFDENHGLLGSGVRPAQSIASNGAVLEVQGSPVAIYKTTDGGMTWTPSVVPANFPGAVTQISMIDSMNGYASVFSDVEFDFNGTFGGSSIWQTTDGGSTWFNSTHLDHIATCVYAQQGLLLFTKWDYYYTHYYLDGQIPNLPIDLSGGGYSYDGGLTWTENFRRGNGIAFSDSLNGVVSEMNDDSGGNNFWVTMDAGRTWQPSISNQFESWSIYAVKGQRTYFCANESQPGLGLPYRSINWSTDGGFTWSQRASFPVMHFTGSIDGVGKTLYFQTDTGTTYSYLDADLYQHGIYRSDDTGATWHFINGPSSSRDTRFVVTGCMGQVVYAFDGFGGVYKTDDGGDGTLIGSFALDSDTITWQPNPCGDTLTFSVSGVNCIPVTVDSVSLKGTTEFLQFPNDSTLPQTLTAGDSTEVRILYSPTKSGKTVSNVTIHAHSGEDVVTKTVTIITQNTTPSGLALSTDTFALSAGACAVAVDSVLLSDLACAGMTLDSVTFSSGEVRLLNTLPVMLPDSISYPLYFVFQPDSAGVDTLTANLYARDGRRSYDTTISIVVRSDQVPEQIIVDSTRVTFATKYCQPMLSSVYLLAFGCDSIVFDSVVSPNGNFLLLHTPARLVPELGDSLRIEYAPDSAGFANDSIKIFAHGKWGVCDTTILLSGSNVSLPQSVTLSQNAITLATGSCLSLFDTLLLGNEGCDALYLDSVMLGDDSEVSVSYDSTVLPLSGGNSLPIRIAYSPLNGNSKALTLRLVMHTSLRVIDTTIPVTISNDIATEPLALSADSLYLFTRYCQPVTLPLAIGNLGCSAMSIDSVVVLGDSLKEFSIPRLADSLQAGAWDSTSVTFTSDSSGSRSISMKVYINENGQTIDTIIHCTAKNLTAPTPYIPSLPTLAAAQTLEIPIMIEPTMDTFSIHSYSFHLSFNTDLLTPTDLDFANTSGPQVLSYKLTPEPGIGCSGIVTLIDTISNTGQFLLPLIFVKTSVSLTADTTTQVTLDTFTTNEEPMLALCSTPESPFTIAFACGDPYLFDLLDSQTISFSFVGVSPNPASVGNWDVDYITRAESNALTLDIYDAAGKRLSHTADLPATVGEHHASIPIPGASGDYFLVLGNDREQTARKGSVAR